MIREVTMYQAVCDGCAKIKCNQEACDYYFEE